MLGCVQTENFFFSRNTQADCLFDDEEGQRNHHGCPCQDADNTQCLNTQNRKATAVEQTVINIICRNGSRCKQTNCQCAPQAIHAVYCDRTNRIVYVENVIQEPYTKAYQQTSNNTNDSRTKGIHNITASSNCNQTSQRSIQAHGNIRLSILDPGKDHTGNSCQRRCNCCGQENGTQLRY